MIARIYYIYIQCSMIGLNLPYHIVSFWRQIPKIYQYSISSYFGPTVCIRILINLLLCFILFIFNNFMANEKSSNTKTVLHYSTVLEECDYVTVRSENNSSHIWNSLWILMTFNFIQLEKETSICKVCYELNLLALCLHWHFQI